MFYYWAIQSINHRDTPFLMYLMNKQISFFKMFQDSDLANNEIVKLFWHEEDSESAIAHIRAVKDEIMQMQ